MIVVRNSCYVVTPNDLISSSRIFSSSEAKSLSWVAVSYFSGLEIISFKPSIAVFSSAVRLSRSLITALSKDDILTTLLTMAIRFG